MNAEEDMGAADIDLEAEVMGDEQPGPPPSVAGMSSGSAAVPSTPAAAMASGSVAGRSGARNGENVFLLIT